MSLAEKRVNLNPSVVFTDLEDGNAVLLDLDSKFYYSLNRTGSFMWKVLEDSGSADIAKVIKQIVEEYEVEETQAERDVEEFVGTLAKEGLISLS